MANTNYKANKEYLQGEFRKVWDSARMVDYCTNEIACMTTLPNGEVITVRKRKIEKDFCFGEHGYDYDDAQDMAHHARTSEDYLKTENMIFFNQWVSDLQDCYENGRTDRLPSYVLAIGDTYDTPTNIKQLVWVRLTDLIDAMGGSVHMEDIPGKTFSHYMYGSHSLRVATKEEIREILDLYKFARQKHEKKVDAYIKKYGTTKVHSWTYWADA